ncbi:MAG: cysteine-rich CWC family protein [Bacteroidales bacterium]|nr:cysteine-rich CWC family protein [Bacteroidales bacterium]
MNDSLNPALKTCPRCGRQFECLHSEGCWCYNYTISPEYAEKLSNEFNYCLCPECLPIFAENHPVLHPERLKHTD